MIYQDSLEPDALEQYAAALNGRAKRSGAEGQLTVASLRDRILASGGCCEWCGASLVNTAFELDHVVSLKQSGSNTPANLVVACPECNRRKGQKHPARFAAEIYSQTGRRTDLVNRVFQHFSLEPAAQLSLFATAKRNQEEFIDKDGDISDKPHYRW